MLLCLPAVYRCAGETQVCKMCVQSTRSATEDARASSRDACCFEAVCITLACYSVWSFTVSTFIEMSKFEQYNCFTSRYHERTSIQPIFLTFVLRKITNKIITSWNYFNWSALVRRPQKKAALWGGDYLIFISGQKDGVSIPLIFLQFVS